MKKQKTARAHTLRKRGNRGNRGKIGKRGKRGKREKKERIAKNQTGGRSK